MLTPCTRVTLKGFARTDPYRRQASTTETGSGLAEAMTRVAIVAVSQISSHGETPETGPSSYWFYVGVFRRLGLRPGLWLALARRSGKCFVPPAPIGVIWGYAMLST
jgi:hypothetical protein